MVSAVRACVCEHAWACLPVDVVVCWRHEQAARGLVSVIEGRGEAHWRLLQAAAHQPLATAGAVIRDREAENVLVAVAQPDEAGLHQRLSSSSNLLTPHTTHPLHLSLHCTLITLFFCCTSVTCALVFVLPSLFECVCLCVAVTPGCQVTASHMASFEPPAYHVTGVV